MKTSTILHSWSLLTLHLQFDFIASDSDIQRRLDACHRAIMEKGAIEQLLMQGIFFGLPRSGKTSTKKRLVGKKLAAEEASTGVSEKVSRVEIEKTTVQFVSRLMWNEIIDLNEETAMIVEDIADHLGSGDEHSHATIKQIGNTPSRLQTVVHKMMAKLSRKKKTSSTKVNRHKTGSEKCHATNPLQILDSALQQSTTLLCKREGLFWTLYLSDAGGQPEFQETLPAIVSGPSLYFLTFPLHKGLNTKYLVEYQHPNGSSLVPFQSSITTKEAVLSSLASIASTRSYTKVNGEIVTPKVLIIATHRDKLESEEQLIQIDRELQQAVRKTAAYHENMIEFHSEAQMIFDLDNTSDNDDDIQKVRDAVERLGTRSGDYKIQTPHTWMIFGITLRHHPGRVLSIDECREIGRVCGIDTQEELNNALWFLHYNLGIIRHFQEVPDLVGVVIKEPQYIFDKITELIINTFTFEAVGPFIREEFVKKGIIPTDMLKKLSTRTDDLTVDQLTILMEHLNVIVPIEESGQVVKYFAPCALTHAEPPLDKQSQAEVPPIMITFESGYCPKGIFGSLVVKLLNKDKMSSFEWKLNQDRIYRNQISLSVGPYDFFEFSLFPTHIKISLDTITKLCRTIPLGRVCCDVIREVESNIRTVTEALHYTQRASHSLAFACPDPVPHDQSHAANINFSPEGNPCTVTCPLSLKVHHLPSGHMFWFDEVCSLAYFFFYSDKFLCGFYFQKKCLPKQELNDQEKEGEKVSGIQSKIITNSLTQFCEVVF